MSSWNTYIKIVNDFSGELNDPKPVITAGKLVGRLPATIQSEGGTSQIQVNAENGDDGSAGSFNYDIVIGNKTYTLGVTFTCNNALENTVTCKSPAPSLMKVDVSPYAQDDHPLRATITLSAV